MFDVPNPPIDQSISPQDGMHIAGQEAHYFECGYSAVQNIHAALFVAGLKAPKKILDLACGHGRVLRMLKAYFPAAEITACDIQNSAVDFCGETFAVNKVYSDENFELMNQSESFDLIWCGSLLTHIDQPKWNKFFDFCTNSLTENGLLVFTTHGRYVTRMILEYDFHYGLNPDQAIMIAEKCKERGFGYCNYPNKNDYGISVALPSWVTSFVETHTELQFCLVNEMGWDNHQDVYACFSKQSQVKRHLDTYAEEIMARELSEVSETDLQTYRSSFDEFQLKQKIIEWVERHAARDAMPIGPRVRQILVRELTGKMRERLAP